MNTVVLEHLDRDECAVLMTYSALQELKDKGVVDGGAFEVSEAGKESCDKLRAAGFEFNPGEMEGVLAWLLSGGEQRAIEARA